MTADTYLQCTVCGRKSTTSFASSLRHGWERCCGYTMRLERTDADIDAAVGEQFEGVKAAITAHERHLAQMAAISDRLK